MRKSAFPQDMLLWPDGQPRVLNSDNRWKGEINGVKYAVDVKGDFANCAFIKNHTTSDLGQDRSEVHRMYQPHFNVIGIVLACAEVAEGHSLSRETVGLRRGPNGESLLSDY